MGFPLSRFSQLWSLEVDCLFVSDGRETTVCKVAGTKTGEGGRGGGGGGIDGVGSGAEAIWSALEYGLSSPPKKKKQ
jgi:hypothetical protein